MAMEMGFGFLAHPWLTADRRLHFGRDIQLNGRQLLFPITKEWNQTCLTRSSIDLAWNLKE